MTDRPVWRSPTVDERLAKDKAAKLPHLKVISVAPLLADAIRRIHGNESISDLFRE